MDELEEMISEDITLDARVHARIIGARGKGIRKIMDEFKVRTGQFLFSGIKRSRVLTVLKLFNLFLWQNPKNPVIDIIFTLGNSQIFISL